MAFVCHRYNGQVVGLYELALVTDIGRHRDSHIRLNDPLVSSRHAQLSLDIADASWHLTNLSQTNGVTLAGQQVDIIVLSPGCRFLLATHEFEFVRELPQALLSQYGVKQSWVPGICFDPSS